MAIQISLKTRRQPIFMCIALTLASGISLAQTDSAKSAATAAKTVDAEAGTLDEITVLGLRQTVRSSIAAKRDATAIVDAISSTEIGGLPATSIGEAIETITGAATHREKGGATEIAIRGLGPFLGSSTFNGREASNGSGDRSVNFNQFPSELINGITIYKSQQANLIEGGVSGQIEIETLKPLDYGKQRIQIELEGNKNAYQSRINDDIGYRGTASYVDQFNVGDGRLGVSVGVQRNDTNNPEEVFSSSSSWIACDPARPSSSTANCNAVSRASAAAGADFYTVAGSRTFRQISEDDRRDAVFAAVQFQPNDALEINVDLQRSSRTFNEIRQDLNLSETLRGISNPIYSDTGVLLAYDGFSSLESTSLYRTQDEDYNGGGLNVAWDINDRIQLTTDLSSSETTRIQIDRGTRLRSDDLDINGVRTALGNQRVPYRYDARNGDVPTITFDPRFDITNWDLFSDDARMRRDEQFRNNKVDSLRLDLNWLVSGNFWSELDLGVRGSRLSYSDYDDRVEITQDNRAIDRQINLDCRIDFPQSNFLRTDSGNVISGWATFDPVCQYLGYLGVADPGRNDDVRAIANNDVREKTYSAYAMGSFSTELGARTVRGNLGLRAVRTSVQSFGLRSDIAIENNADGSISLVEIGDFTAFEVSSSYSRLLPSLNVTMDVNDQVLLRGGLFRAMSRPDLSSLGAGRTILLQTGESFSTVSEAIRQITATGSPRLEPLMSWNGDLSLEIYPNPDSILSLAVYYKQFEGGFSNAVFNEEFLIDGQSLTVPVVQQQNSGEKSRIFGAEISAAHRFSSFKPPFDGLGVKLGYNYADSNFKTEDIVLGDLVNPFTGVVDEGIIPPADIFGLSKHVLSSQLFWELGPVELQAIYKFRSNYYQKFVGGPSQLRYVDDVRTVDMRAGFRLSRNVSLQVEALNVLDQPKVTYMPIQDSIREYNSYGARYYAGITMKF